ncbi:MAG: phosphatase PAP2 family protein [Aeromicrobium sp.]
MRRWPYTFAVVVSVAIGTTAIVSARILDLPIRDPDGFLGPSYVRLPLIVLLFFAAGIIPTALRRYGIRGFFGGVVRIVDEEWTWKRLSYILVGLSAFYACYVSYRNLKSYLPVVREGVLFDHRMLQLDHFLMFGHNPATVLHNLLGTGAAAHILAFVYVSYLMLIPLTLGAFLVWGRDLSLGAWYATALSLNWVLGTISYYMLPTLGPAFAQPQSFLELPDTSASSLQRALFRAGAGFKEDPTGNQIYGIAGFASLHVSVVLAACLFFARVGLNGIIRWSAWIYLLFVVLATIYFGWHYIADDIAGAAIGWISVSLGAWATGNRGRRRRHVKGNSPAEEIGAIPDEVQPAAAGASETGSRTA